MKKNQTFDKKKVYFICLGASLGLIFFFSLVFFLGREWSSREDFGERHNLDEKNSDLDNDYFLYYFRIANQAYLENRLEEVFESVSKIEEEKLSPYQSYQLYMLKSCVLMEKSLYERALKNVDLALSFHSTAFALFLKASILEYLGKQDAMMDTLRESIKINSSFRMSYEKLGDYFFQEKDFSQASNYYQKVDKAGLPLASVRIKLALVDFNKGLYKKSIKRLNSLGSIEKGHYLSFVYFLLGMNYFFIDEQKKFDENFKKAVKSAPSAKKVFYFYYWAKLNTMQKSFKRSVSLLQSALAISDSNHSLFFNVLKDLAYVSFHLGRYEEGLEHLQKIRDKAPDLLNDTLRYHLAVFYYKNKQYENAEKDFKFVLKQSASEELLQSSMYLLAQIYYQQKKYDESKKMLQDFSRSWGSSPLIVYGLMKLEIAENNHSFLELYKQYTKENKEKKYDLLLAKYFVDIKEYSSAIAIYSDHIKENPSFKNFILLADLYQHIKESDLSLYYYDRAWEKASSDSEKEKILNNKSRVLIQEGRIDEAKNILISLAKTAKTPVIYWYNLALLFLSKNDKNNYKKMIHKAYLSITGKEENKIRALIHFHYALIKARSYQFKQARALIEKAYTLDSTNEKIAYYQKKGFKDFFRL